MSYVIYHFESTLLLNVWLNKRYTLNNQYDSVKGAKIALTRFTKKYSFDPKEFGACETQFFYDCVEKKVEKVNMMNGQPFTIGVNTPAHCDPSKESYWSF